MNTLRLTPSRELPRVLFLSRTDYTFTAIVYGRGARGRMYAYASDRHVECRLDSGGNEGPCIWIGRAAFDVSAKEAEKIRAAFPDLRVCGTDSGAPASATVPEGDESNTAARGTSGPEGNSSQGIHSGATL